MKSSPQLSLHSCVAACLCLLIVDAQLDEPSTATTTTAPPARTDILYDPSSVPANATPSPTPQTRNPSSRRVNIPPLITVNPPKDAQFRQRESIELPCEAEGIPTPFYRWTYNDAPFDPSGNDGRIAIQPGVGTLIFARPIARDEAYYQCFAYNVVGIAVSYNTNLRLGVLEAFPKRSVRRNYPQIGSSLTLRCTPPTSFPHPNIFWAVITADNRFSPVDYTDRVTIDPIGNLHFVNVQPEDAKGNATYACVVENRVMRGIQRGEYNKISPHGVTVRLYPPRILWQSPTQQIAMRGETWTVKCVFAGSPTPRVTWKRIGKEMPVNHRLTSFGQELNIDNVQYEDAGKYECQGINDMAMVPVRRSMDLSVESAPYWVEKPMSQDVAENETGTFHCRGEGIPNPTIKWLINGVPVTEMKEDPRRIGGLLYDLTFANVTIKDAKVIQCNISNKHGYNYTNAYINVYTEPPFILEGPMIGLRAAEHQTINLTCKVFGSPKPHVVWKKGDEQLTGGRYRVLEDGNLEISDLSLVDGGTYTCTATNRLGYIEAVGTLLVRRKTQIVTAPMDMMIPEGMEAKFTCTGTTDPEEVENLHISWKKDNQTINYELAQRVFQNAIDNSVTISGTQYLDTGKYTCVASNGLDSSEASAQLIVQAVPDPPVSIIVRCNSVNRTAEIWWQPGKENYAPILNFIVQYNTSFQPDLWYNIATNVSQNSRRIVVTMSPWGNYTFRVMSRNKIGLSLPSFQSRNVCHTEPGVPDTNPENVIGEGDQPGNLVIFWTPMPKIEQNGPDFKYVVTYQRVDLENAVEHVANVQNPEAWHYVVPDRNLGIFKPFRITVKANSARGDSTADLNAVIGYSGEDVPLVRPVTVMVDVDSIRSTSARLFWRKVDLSPDKVRGFFRGYRMQFAKEGPDWNNQYFRELDRIVNESALYPRPRMKRQVLYDDNTTVTIAYDNRTMDAVTVVGLPPSSTVMIQVRVLTKYFVGPASDPVRVTTPEGVPGPPKSLSVAVIGATHFMMEWLPPDEPNGHIIGYHFSYQSITNLNLGRLQYRDITDDPDARVERVTGLNPNTTYRVYLRAATSVGTGEPIFVDATTELSGPPDPPSFSIMNMNGTWAKVAWEPSRSGVPGSVFYVQYRQRGHYEWLRSPDEYLHNYMVLVDLNPGTTYQVRVVAKNGDGYEAGAVWLEFHTPGVAPGDFHLPTAGWFYGIWICLFLILVILIVLIVAKKYTDKNWEEKEALIEDQVRQLQAEEAARQMGVFNQYQQPGDTDASDYKGRDDYDAAAGYGYDDAKEYEPGAKYSPHYGAGGQYVMGAAKGSDSDTFV